MNHQSIQIFLAVVKYNGISAAARALNYTQPTVSEYLNQLEKQLGVRLIVRKRGIRQVILTPEGEAFLPLAQRQAELDEAVERFISTQKQKSFRLAASSSAHEYIVSHIVQRLMRKNPGLEIRLITKELREIPNAIETNSFDAAICFTSVLEHPLVDVVPFFQEERYILCRKDAIFPDRLLSVEELDPQKEVMYSSNLKRSQLPEWHRQNFPNSSGPMVHSDSVFSLKNYLTSKDAWTVIPASIAHYIMSQQTDALSIRQVTPKPPDRKCSIAIAKSYPHEKIMTSFLQCCSDFAEEHPYLQNMLTVKSDE